LLSPQAQSVLTIAAVIGQEFDLALLKRVSQLKAEPLAELTRETSEVGVVTAASREGYRFTHPLIRESLYKGSTDAERMRLHLAIGEALEQMHAANLTPRLAELAHHFLEARIVEKAIDYSIRAGDEARRIFAHEDAGSHWSTALELLEESGEDRHLHADLHHRLGELMGGQGERGRRLEHLEEALRTYEELGDANGAAQLHLSLGNNLSIVGLARAQDIPRAADHLRRAEAVLSKGPENPDLVKLYFFIGSVAAQSCRVRDAVVAFRHSMEIAERIGHSEFWAMSAGSLTWILPQTGKIGEALEVQAQVWSKLDTLNTPGFASATVAWSGYCLMQLWDPRGAQKWWGTELAKSRLGRGQRKVFMRVLQDAYLLSGDLPAARSLLEQEPHASAAGMLAFYEGDWDRADSILEQGLERARSGMPSEMFLYGQVLARVRWNRGEPTRAETLLREALAPYPDEEPHCQVEMVVRPELALVYLEMRQQEDAVAQVSRCREVSAGEDWRGLGGHLARADAAVAAAEGKLDAALAGFESAVTIFRKYALPWEEADTLHRWGRTLLAAAPDRANQKFDAAIEIYRRHGAGQRWIDRVEGERQTSAGSSVAQRENGAPQSIFRREGEYWTLEYQGGKFRLRDSKGLQFIANLIGTPGREVRANDLANSMVGPPSARDRHDHQAATVAGNLGDAGAILDAQAKTQYRLRLRELRAELEEAEGNNDLGRAESARAELEAIESQLASALGLGGRDRKGHAHSERARWMVTNSIKRAIAKIDQMNPPLGRHLHTCIRTGNFCSYTPDPEHPVAWQL
jgi:tetratricopeptide (TPR) repeat protein